MPRSPETRQFLQLHETAIELWGTGAAYLPESRCLLVADLHLGKDRSFRRSGIPVPHGVTLSMLDQLRQLLTGSEARSLVFLGDLIHDPQSLDDDLIRRFTTLRQLFPQIRFQLVRGNHDRWCAKFPDAWELEESDSLVVDGVRLVHDLDREPTDQPVVGGHRHPVCLVGTRADRCRLRCFVADSRRLILPAFGAFKGGCLETMREWKLMFPIHAGQIWRMEKQ